MGRKAGGMGRSISAQLTGARGDGGRGGAHHDAEGGGDAEAPHHARQAGRDVLEQLAGGRHLDARAQDLVRGGEQDRVEDLEHMRVEQAHAPPEHEEEQQRYPAQHEHRGPAELPAGPSPGDRRNRRSGRYADCGRRWPYRFGFHVTSFGSTSAMSPVEKTSSGETAEGMRLISSAHSLCDRTARAASSSKAMV